MNSEAPVCLIRRLSPRAEMPSRAYSESAAFDLAACILSPAGYPLTWLIAPRTTKLIPTGLAMLPPPGHCILVCSRSGLATRSVFVANAPGVVDPDYTGELRIALYNGGLEPHYVKNGDRVGQALIIPFASCGLREVEDFPRTERGEKGFGSTGA